MTEPVSTTTASVDVPASHLAEADRIFRVRSDLLMAAIAPGDDDMADAVDRTADGPRLPVPHMYSA